jgi:uncharacterized damage-inducible protein DinB
VAGDQQVQPPDFAHFFDYLVLARQPLFNWVTEQPTEIYVRPFPFGLGSIRATLLHVAEVEWGYAQRLTGKDHLRTASPFTAERHPALPSLISAWDTQRPATRRALAEIRDPGRPIEYVSRNFSPPRHIRTTGGAIAWQMLFHEVHHRAQVMTMLRLTGVPAQDLDYRRLMWERTPERS